MTVTVAVTEIVVVEYVVAVVGIGLSGGQEALYERSSKGQYFSKQSIEGHYLN